MEEAKENFGRMFDRTLEDMIRGMRRRKDGEAQFIRTCIEEIKMEMKQSNISAKVNAIKKLYFLQMQGYDISWAGFSMIEVMSSAKFSHKRIGYLVASQTFHVDHEMLLLTPNMIRKDLNSHNQYDAGNALSALACFVSYDLAKDLANDVLSLLNSSKPYLRKKAVLMMYRIFLKFPDALKPSYPLLKMKLEDPDPSVQSAAVHVICELARKNPKNYLSLAPVLFKLLTTSSNNWMVIKIVKLFGALTPLEPRLAKKLIEPLTNIIHSTSAMSLLYECINTTIAVLISISAGMPDHTSSIQLCSRKLRHLIEHSDPNIKYLGLLAMSRILPSHPKFIHMHKDNVMTCLDTCKDDSIRLRALDLLYGMVDRKNLMEIVKKLVRHLEVSEGTDYRSQLLRQIVRICSQNNYQHVTNFQWFISVLIELSRLDGLKDGIGDSICAQLLDVAIRVHGIRPFVVQQMSLIIENPGLILLGKMELKESSMIQVLNAAAWICGEYCQFLPDAKRTLISMLDTKVTLLPPCIQKVYIQNSLKIFTHIMCHPLDQDDQFGPQSTKCELKDEIPQDLQIHEVNLLDLNAFENDLNTFAENPKETIAIYDEAETKTEISSEHESTEDFENSKNNSIEQLPNKRVNNLEEIQTALKPFLISDDVEVQERATCLNGLIKCFLKLEKNDDWSAYQNLANEVGLIFETKLNPVAPKSQKKVPVPSGLDLDSWINKPSSHDKSKRKKSFDEYANEYDHENIFGDFLTKEITLENATENKMDFSRSEERETNVNDHESNPYYLKSPIQSRLKMPSFISSSPAKCSTPLINNWLRFGLFPGSYVNQNYDEILDTTATSEVDNQPLTLNKSANFSDLGFASSDTYYLEQVEKAKKQRARKKAMSSKSKKMKDKKVRANRKEKFDIIEETENMMGEDSGIIEKRRKFKARGTTEKREKKEVANENQMEIVSSTLEIPDGVNMSENEDESTTRLAEGDPHRALNVAFDD